MAKTALGGEGGNMADGRGFTQRNNREDYA